MNGRRRSAFIRALSTMAALGLLAALGAGCPAAVRACVSLTTPGSPYTQNFDTLSNVPGTTNNSLFIIGWFLSEGGLGARDNELYAVDTGASTTGDTYSYGAAGSSDRALGLLRSNALFPVVGACFTNDTGAAIARLDLAYTGEEWRLGTIGRADQLNFEYSLDATSLDTGSWTGVVALDFITPDTGTAGAKDGNSAADRTALSGTISGLGIPNGATFWVRWTDTDVSGSDDGLAVDDFSLTPQQPLADLAVTKVDSPDPVKPGGNLTYTITVANNGPNAASTASLSDPLPAGTTYVGYSLTEGWACTTPPSGSTGTVSCSSLSQFAAGGSAVLTLTVNVDSSLPSGTILANTATAVASTADPNPLNNTAATTTIVLAPPTISEVSPATGPAAGGTAVTITGADFAGVTAVTFGATSAAGFTLDSDTQITATSPRGTPGTVHITVTSPAGTSTPGTADQFTYYRQDQTITVTSHAPAGAPVGTGFDVAATAGSGLPVAILSSGVCTGSGTGAATITMTAGTGTCTVNFDQAGDDAWQPAPRVTETTIVLNLPPVMGAVGNRTVSEGEQVLIVLSATDPDEGDTLAFSASDLPAGASWDAATATFAWTPGYDQGGSYDVTFTVTDSGMPPMSDSDTVTITVTDHDPTLFADDFESGSADGDDDWLEVLGVWKTVLPDAGNRFFASSKKSRTALAVVDDFTFRDGRIAAGFKVGRAAPVPGTTRHYPRTVMLVFNLADAIHYRAVKIRQAASGKWKLTVVQVGDYDTDTKGTKASAVLTSFNPKLWHRMSLDVHAGGRVAVSLDGAQVTEHAFSPDNTGGQVGFMTKRTAGPFDDVLIEDATVLP